MNKMKWYFWIPLFGLFLFVNHIFEEKLKGINSKVTLIEKVVYVYHIVTITCLPILIAFLLK